MSMDGWIKVHRSILDNPIWSDRPFSKGQAWIDIILLANHKGKDVLVGNRMQHISRGSFLTSELKLMDRWGWSKKKVRGFLELLVSVNMIEKNGNRQGTVINVVNYGKYQDFGTENEPIRDHEGTERRPRRIHNQERKNDKNDKNGIDNMSSGTSAERDPEYPYKEIVDYLNQKAGTSYRSTSKDTRKHIQARVNEGYTVEDLKAVIDKKIQEWGGEPKPGEKDMRPYIRPSTLFGTKFENYLQAPSAKQTRSVNNGFNNFQGRDYKDMSDLERKLIQ